MLENGATLPNVKTVPFFQGHGVVTDTILKTGDSLMTIPKQLLLTDFTARQGSTLARQMSKWLNYLRDDPGQLFLTLFLLEHMLGFKGSTIGHHFFQPYFDILPSSLEAYASIPATWTQAELALLKETSMAYNAAVSYKRNCMNDYDVFASVRGNSVVCQMSNPLTLCAS